MTAAHIQKATAVAPDSSRPLSEASPLLPGDDEDIIEEEEVDLLPGHALEEDAVVLHKRRQLSSLHHPPGGGDQWERLEQKGKRGNQSKQMKYFKMSVKECV